MKMDEMNKLFEDHGFTVERKWEPEHDIYRFTIGKNNYFLSGLYSYPVGAKGDVGSRHQRDFVESMINSFNAEYGPQVKDIEVKQEIMWSKTNPWLAPNIKIKNVIFNDPATIVFWTDGTKTVVKCQDGDEFNPETGLAMAISKKALGNKGNYCNEFKKWLPETEIEKEAFLYDIKLPDTSVIAKAAEAMRNFGKEVRRLNKKSSIRKAYDLLVECRDKGKGIGLDEVIGYLSDALED